MADKVFAIPNVQTPSVPVRINPDKCVGCNTCVETCQIDVFIPNPKKGGPPILLHPEECWYCGCGATTAPPPEPCSSTGPCP